MLWAMPSVGLLGQGPAGKSTTGVRRAEGKKG